MLAGWDRGATVQRRGVMCVGGGVRGWEIVRWNKAHTVHTDHINQRLLRAFLIIRGP
jgi:hypothetical protein